MDKSKKNPNPEIIKKSSVVAFDKAVKLYIYGGGLFYYGSYIFDVLGQEYKYDDISIDCWLEDDLRHSFEKENPGAEYDFGLYNIAKAAFQQAPEASFTVSIQRQYLDIKNWGILHIYCEPPENNNEEVRDCCELLLRQDSFDADSTASFSHDSVEIKDLLTEEGIRHEDYVVKAFNWHYAKIRESGYAHLYFFPTVLEISPSNVKIINVSTIIGPESLSDSELNVYQYGFECSSVKIMADTAQFLYNHAQEEAKKSAKAAIMSRNMSHNLGSHVMAYLKQHLSSVTTMLNDNVLTRLCGDKVDYDKLLDYLEKNVPGFKAASDSNTPANVSPIDKVSSRLALPFLVGLGQFVSYLQERQDFIATISTDYIPYYATVNFKDSIYDELNPDKRYERHQDRKNLQLDNILLGNIARSEGLGRPTSPTKENGGKLCDIVLKFNDFDGNPCKEGTPAYNSLEDLRRFNVSLPGGIVGRQAVFSIVENIIRNAAKHGSWRDIGKLELTFRKYDLLSDTIPDNDNLDGHKSLREVIDAYYRPAVDINDLYVVTLTDNTECSEESLQKLRKALDDDYVDSSGIMKSANKGLKEMRISAAWIRAIKDESSCVNMQLADREDAEYISKHGLRAPVIYARIATDEFFGEHLQYIFCLPKPKVLAVISDSLAEQRRDVQLEGCRFYSEHEFELENNKSYEFILCGSERFERIRPFASARTVTFEESGIHREELLTVKDDATLQLLLERLYKNETIFGYKDGDVINIDDKKASDNLERHIVDFKETSLPINTISVVKEENEADGISTFVQDDPSVKGLSIGSYFRRGHVIVSDGKICGQYIYRTHHDSFEQFSKFMDSNISPQFVEGITGNNSTDRLIRNEVIDESWFHRHLHAMKVKVAICDERLFSKVTGLEETDFTRGKVKLANLDNFDEIKQYYAQLSPEDTLTISGFDSPEKLNKYVDNNFRAVLQEPERLSKGLSVSSYSQRRIFVFSFIQDAEVAAKFFLVGLYMEKKSPEGILSPVYKDAANHQYECKCARLAELTWSNETGLSIISDNFQGGQYCNHFFDYLTIHQGLLDKLYEAFGIKDNPEGKDLLTRGLYEYFCKIEKQKIIPVKVKTSEKVEERTFLSGMMVHSGRSKPGLQDMPQVLPFIQYAALEHAVMDCKFSLVELLDHARYEL